MTTKIDEFTESLRHSLTAIASQLDTATAYLIGAAWKLTGERKRLESHADRAEENTSAAVLDARGDVIVDGGNSDYHDGIHATGQ